MDKRTKSLGYIEVFGKQPVHEALSGGWPVREIITRGDPQDHLVKSSVNFARGAGVKVTALEPPAFDRRFSRSTQGVVAVVKQVAFSDPDDILAGVPSGRQPLFLALDGIEDPQNLGAIIRTAYAMGVDAVVIPRRRSAAIGEGAAKSSAGALLDSQFAKYPTSTVSPNGPSARAYGSTGLMREARIPYGRRTLGEEWLSLLAVRERACLTW